MLLALAPEANKAWNLYHFESALHGGLTRSEVRRIATDQGHSESRFSNQTGDMLVFEIADVPQVVCDTTVFERLYFTHDKLTNWSRDEAHACL